MTDDERIRRVTIGHLVEHRLAELATTPAAIAKTSGVSSGTIRSLVNGARWPTATSRAAIEVALGWKLGELTRLAHGDGPSALRLSDVSDIDLVLELLHRVKSRELAT